MKQKSIPVKNLNCQSCTAKLPNIPYTTFKTSLLLQKILVTYDDTRVNILEIKKKLKQSGFLIAKRETHELLFLLTTLNLVLLHITNSTNNYVFRYFTQYFICFLLYWFCIYKIAKNSSFIVLISSILAFLDANQTTAVFILWYLIFGKLILDLIYKNKVKYDSTLNCDFVDNYDKKVEDNFCTVTINEIKPGDTVKIKPYQIIPVDGYITDICSLQKSKNKIFAFIDESAITGELKLVKKEVRKNDTLYAGTKNQDCTISIKATKTKKETLQGQIISMLQKNSYAKKVNNVTMAKFYEILFMYSVFVFIVHFLLYIFDCQPELFSESMPILVPFKIVLNIVIIACPCALNLSKPLVCYIVSRILQKHGIIVGDGECLTKNVEVAVFDKTGTLSDGFMVQDMIYYGYINDVQKNVQYETKGICITKENMHSDVALLQFLLILQNIEKDNVHVIAKAIYRHCTELLENYDSNTIIQSKTCEYVPGFGIKGQVLVNNAIINFSITKESDMHIIYFNDKIIAKLRITEKIKEGAIELIKYLYKQQINVILCTGDTKESAENVAKRLGIQKIHYKQTSNMKYNIMKDLQKKHSTMMIGDGVNDLPALKAADVGLSVNAIYNESSVSFIGDDITLIKTFCYYADIARRRVKFCYNFSLFYNIICVLVASGLFIALDLYVDIEKSCLLMFWSSLFVIGNALWICLLDTHVI